MITQDQIVRQTNNLSTCKSLRILELAQRETFNSIEKASTLGLMTKAELRKKLQSKVSQIEMSFIRNLKNRLKAFVSQTQNKINYISIGDMISLRGIENEVTGSGGSLAWLVKDLSGVNFLSARNLLGDISNQRSNLLLLIEAKKKEFEEEEKKEKLRLAAIALLEKKRKEQEQRRRQEEERRRREAARRRRGIGGH